MGDIRRVDMNIVIVNFLTAGRLLKLQLNLADLIGIRTMT